LGMLKRVGFHERILTDKSISEKLSPRPPKIDNPGWLLRSRRNECTTGVT
jgi:hypothetical protein